MPDPTQTIRDYPPPSIRARALDIARAQLGRHEEGNNEGLIVRWAIEGFTDRHGAAEGQKWCAWFAAQCIRRAIIETGDQALRAEWDSIVSGSCTTLFQHLRGKGWAWVKGEALPPALAGPECVSGLPDCGDLVFYGDAARLHHVGLLSRRFGLVHLETGLAGDVAIISGNDGDAVREQTISVNHVFKAWPGATLYGFARVPW